MFVCVYLDPFTDNSVVTRLNGEHKEKDLEPWDAGDQHVSDSLESLDTDLVRLVYTFSRLYNKITYNKICYLHFMFVLYFSQMAGILMTCLNTTRKHMVWSLLMIAACLHIRKCPIFTYDLYRFIGLLRLIFHNSD